MKLRPSNKKKRPGHPAKSYQVAHTETQQLKGSVMNQSTVSPSWEGREIDFTNRIMTDVVRDAFEDVVRRKLGDEADRINFDHLWGLSAELGMIEDRKFAHHMHLAERGEAYWTPADLYLLEGRFHLPHGTLQARFAEKLGALLADDAEAGGR